MDSDLRPNQAHSLDGAERGCLHVRHHRRAASDARRFGHNARHRAMNTRINYRRLGIVALIAVVAALAIAWASGLFPQRRASVPANALIVIAPYRHAGTWVFDDPKAGLVREPFVAGVPEMIDLLVRDIPGATNGFRLLFSAQPFPGYQKKLTWLRGDMGGNYYKMEEPAMEGWICPAMFRYYKVAPKELYVKAESKK